MVINRPKSNPMCGYCSRCSPLDRLSFLLFVGFVYLRALHNDQACQDLEACPEYNQKALELRTPLVQNGFDDH